MFSTHFLLFLPLPTLLHYKSQLNDPCLFQQRGTVYTLLIKASFWRFFLMNIAQWKLVPILHHLPCRTEMQIKYQSNEKHYFQCRRCSSQDGCNRTFQHNPRIFWIENSNDSKAWLTPNSELLSLVALGLQANAAERIHHRLLVWAVMCCGWWWGFRSSPSVSTHAKFNQEGGTCHWP